MASTITDCREVYQEGDGATISIGGDRYPATVVRVTKKTVVVQNDFVHTVDGEQRFLPNKGAEKQRFFLGPTGRLRWSGSFYLSHGRSHYIDPHF